MQWIAKHATNDPVTVLDIGGRNINGTPRPLFPNATRWVCLDIIPGDGVTIVADAADWEPVENFDVVIAAETFEHAENWPRICRTAYAACKPGGMFIITTAAPGRPVHSGVDGGGTLHPGEHYANVPGFELERVLAEVGWRHITVDVQPSPADTRAVATR